MLKLIRPFLAPLLVATLLMVIGSGVSLWVPALAGNALDAVFQSRDPDALDRLILQVLAVFGLMAVAQFFQSYLIRATGARLVRQMRSDVFAHVVTLTPEFYESRQPGELLSRLGSDLSMMQRFLTTVIPNGIQALLRFVGAIIILLLLHPELTAVSLLVIPPAAIFAVFYGKRMQRLAAQAQDELAKASATAEEVFNGIKTVQAFCKESFETSRFGERLQNLLDVQLRNAWVLGAFGVVLEFAALVAFAIVLWYGGHLSHAGQLSPGDLTSFMLYSLSIAASVNRLGSLYAGYRELIGSSSRVFEILDAKPISQPARVSNFGGSLAGRIEFRDVSFAYPSATQKKALNQVSFEVERGQVIGFVGPSGGGKSTIFALLLRFYEVSAGSILLDNVDLTSIPVSDLRRNIAIVPQDIFLFSGTVEENIAYGLSDVSPERVRKAAWAADAHGFIEALPQGYQEKVGPRGVRLSAGQRQRIAIARALLKNPPVLLLDEMSSSLDSESEDHVQNAISNLLVGRTTLIIAHRLATARKADRIIVIDKGQAVAMGTHAELYANNEIYRNYWELQSLPLHAEDGRSKNGNLDTATRLFNA